jgi:peptidoglycan hydrolase-like protein with peptidoglycan-binding domain
LCEYGEKETPTESNPFGGTQCSTELIISDNMKKGDRNSKYSSYNKGIVTQVNILQGHMNRLLLDEYGNQASGPVDGIFGPLTKRGVERLQNRLNQLFPAMIPLSLDGIVGPFTKAAINNSCGTSTPVSDVTTIPSVAEVTIDTSSPATSCLFEQNAKPGDEGEYVLKIQNFLEDQGLLTATPNGYYGSATSAAVKAFQTKYPEVYTSAGLSGPTDYFYTNTRAKAEVVCQS